MKIRDATHDDLDALADLGKRMAAESPRFCRLAYDEAKVYALLLNALTDQRYFLVAAEQDDGEVIGGFLGFMAPHWFSSDEVAQDLVLFVRPDRRGGIAAARLVKAFAEWATHRGAKQINLGISTGVKVEQTAELYRALGLKQFGYLFEV